MRGASREVRFTQKTGLDRRKYVPFLLSTRWPWRSHFLAPTRDRISSSRTTSRATRIAPWQRVRRSVRKFSCVGSSSSATSFTGSSLDSPPSEAVRVWIPRSFHFLVTLRELPIHTILETQPRQQGGPRRAVAGTWRARRSAAVDHAQPAAGAMLRGRVQAARR